MNAGVRPDDSGSGAHDPLTPRTRQLVAIAAAVAAGLPSGLEARVSDAIRHDPEILPEIREVIFQVVPYCGWATALNAVGVLRKVLDALGVTMPPGGRPLAGNDRDALRAMGRKTAGAVNPLFEKVAAGLAEFDPELVTFLTETAYGYVYNRPALSLVTRELVAVALLTVSRQDPQLRYHVDGARNVGASPEAVRAAMEEARQVAGPADGVAGAAAVEAPAGAWNEVVRLQFGAAIDMLGNAIEACPDGLWYDRAEQPEFWYLVFHTLFWLDLYLSGTPEGFQPPAPFTLDELDPAEIIPESPYSKAELLGYLEHGSRKLAAVTRELTEEAAAGKCGFSTGAVRNMTVGELLLYNMRHVQHGAAQLNLILRRKTGSAPRWVGRARL